MNQRGFTPTIIIILVVVIGILSGIYYLLTRQLSLRQSSNPSVTSVTTPKPTINPTSNWKTYSNSQYGISFKYPPQWLLENSNSNQEYLFVTIFTDKKGENIGIDGYNNPSNLDPELYYSTKINSSGLEQFQFQTITIGDLQGAEILNPVNSGPTIDTIVRSGSHIFLISAHYASDTAGDISPETKNLFWTMLTTFTFNNQTMAQPGQHCGGFIKDAVQCMTGYHCQLGSVPDTGGTCVKD